MNLLDTSITIQTLLQQVAANISDYQKLLLAFSGGLDSTVLLNLLTALRDAADTSTQTKSPVVLRAMHVNHGLNQDADQWVEHCAQECRLRVVPFSVVRVLLEDTAPGGIEAVARRARYQALRDKLLPQEVLVTAQHLDDQVETLFLALKRGSGPNGLAAMLLDTPYHGHRLLRPLLTCDRAQIKTYAHECQLNWIEDDTNKDIRYDRNFLRLHILPLLQKRWPWFNKAVARSARLCIEQEELLDELLAETVTQLTQPDGSLELIPLVTMTAARRRALFRRWIANRGVKMPSYLQLERIWKEVVLSRDDATPQLQLNDWLLRRFQNRLYLLPISMTSSLGEVILPWLEVEAPLFLPQQLGVLIRHLESSNIVPNTSVLSSIYTNINDTAKVSQSNHSTPKTCRVAAYCVIRAPLTNEKVSVRFGSVSGPLHIVGRHRGRTLKKLWQELKVPPWLRRRTPLLFYNQTLIAGLGVFVTQEGEASKQRARWQIYWLQELSCPVTDHLDK